MGTFLAAKIYKSNKLSPELFQYRQYDKVCHTVVRKH